MKTKMKGVHIEFPDPDYKFGSGATIYPAGPRGSYRDVPTNYKLVGYVRLFAPTRYNSNLATIYSARGNYIYSIYQDGCFYPYLGLIVFDDPIKEN